MKTDEVIIFDLDGTLTDTLTVSVTAAQEAIKHAAGPALQPKDIVAQFGKSEDALFKYYCPQNWRNAWDYYADYFTKNITAAAMFPHIKDALDYLKENKIKTAIVTGRSAKSAQRILYKLGITGYFDDVKTGSESGSIKPQCIREVLAKWRHSPAKAYYIGDIPHDIKDAKEAGVKALCASWHEGVDKPAQLEQAPLAVFHTTKDFLDWIKNNGMS
jgi:HAD superfamily hydrolase (TIGR01549 family)